MHWSCPHCGIFLAISDDHVGNGWAFSKCYKCAGFALIRKVEINVIKVDQAPPGEKVILPEASNDPASALLSSQATRKLGQHIAGKIKPPPFNSNSAAVQSALQTAGLSKPTTYDISSALLPEPLPEIRGKSSSGKPLTVGMAVAGSLAIFSGTFLYIQGHTLWTKSKTTPTEVARRPASTAPETQPVHKTSVVDKTGAVIDQLKQSAMAPTRESASPQHWIVKIKSAEANFHTGPGMEYPILGPANVTRRYVVSDWKENWFKLNAQDQKEIGWVRNDFVQLLWTQPSVGDTSKDADPLR